MSIAIVIVGPGKIARDQHMPTIAASDNFTLAGLVSLQPVLSELPCFQTITNMAAALPHVRAVAICTPPRGRFDLVREAFASGLDVLLEKPPAATVSEAEHMVALAREANRVLYLSWHSREAAAVTRARAWFADHRPRRVTIDWLEDVRVWHPGQEWIWEPGIGVFDPGINALSILTALVRSPRMVAATLDFPANKAAPIAATLEMVADDCRIEAAFSFDQRGQQTWTLHAEAEDGAALLLRNGGTRLTVDGAEVLVPQEPEYARLYRRFADLIGTRDIDADIEPLRLVADAFLIGHRQEVPAFAWI